MLATNERIKNIYGPYTQWCIAEPQKRMKFVMCNNMNQCEAHCIMRNKPGMERKISHDLIHIQSLRSKCLIEVNNIVMEREVKTEILGKVNVCV